MKMILIQEKTRSSFNQQIRWHIKIQIHSLSNLSFKIMSLFIFYRQCVDYSLSITLTYLWNALFLFKQFSKSYNFIEINDFISRIVSYSPQKSMNQYEIISKLGEGAFASVYKVKRKADSKLYALKRIKIQSLSEKQIANCLNEVRILASIDNPYVVAYMDSFYDEISSSFCLVTEFLEGGDLSQYIKKYKSVKKLIKESRIWNVAIQCLKGLKSLHKINIFHRDIKSANILINKEHTVFKLADMNVSKISDNGMAKTQAGTPYYASPEVWKESPYTCKCDIWSLGCVLYEMATSRPPFNATDLKGLKQAIMKGSFKPLPNGYSKELNDFISLCLKVNPEARPSAEELLNSPILKEVTFWKLEKGIENEEEETIDEDVKIIAKIEAPKKRDFHLIRDKLPRNKFSSQEARDKKKSCEKENDVASSNIFSGKITRKSQLPPMLKKSESQTDRNDPTKKNQKHIKFLQSRVVDLCDEALMPPIHNLKQKLMR